MAKKKNAPVLRAQGGDQPETKTITKSYAVRDKWLDKAKDNLVEFKSVDGEISDLLVNGQPAGGGGGGAPIYNVTWNITDGPAWVTPVCVEDNGTLNCAMFDPETNKYQTYNDSIQQTIANGTHTVKYVCFNPEGFTIIDSNEGSVTTSGNVTYDGSSFSFKITGDCTISISYA